MSRMAKERKSMPYVLAERGHKYPAADSREHVRGVGGREEGAHEEFNAR